MGVCVCVCTMSYEIVIAGGSDHQFPSTPSMRFIRMDSAVASGGETVLASVIIRSLLMCVYWNSNISKESDGCSGLNSHFREIQNPAKEATIDGKDKKMNIDL